MSFFKLILLKTQTSRGSTNRNILLTLFQSILREINSEYLLEGLVLKLKLRYFGHWMRTADSLEKSLILGKIEGRKEMGVTG